MISVIGLAIATALVIFLIVKGYPLYLVAFIGTAIIALAGGMNVYDAFLGSYMGGVMNYFGKYFLMFGAGAIFGKMMEVSGAAEAVAYLIIEKIGEKRAALAVVLSCGIMCYGGISLFVVVFTVYPIAASLYEKANMPARFIPGAIALGSVTFSMTAPGAPQIHNLVPAGILGTTPMAGAVVGFIVSIFLLVFGMFWYMNVANKCMKHGEGYSAPIGFKVERKSKENLPNGLLALTPMIVVILLLNLAKLKIEISVLSGLVWGIIIFHKQLTGGTGQLVDIFSTGLNGGLDAIMNSCSMVGFGAVMAASPAFQIVLDTIMRIPGPPLVGVAVTTTLVSGIAGSGSSAVGIVTPVLGPIYLALGVPAAALHRIIAISSGGMDTMPHAGYVCTTLKTCGGITHKQGYMMICRMTVLTPLLGCAIAIVLFTLFPGWP